MGMVDAQSVKGGRYGPTFHDTGGPGGRVFGTKRTLLVEILGLPVAAHATSALWWATAPTEGWRRSPAGNGWPSISSAHRPAPAASCRSGPLSRSSAPSPQLGRWRRLSRCNEGIAASARAWLEVASVGYLVWRVVA